jgi:hypothetical protein
MVLATAPTHAGSRSVAVHLRTLNQHRHVIKLTVSDADASRMLASTAEVAALVEKAKRIYADRLGFSAARYGADSWKLVPGLRVHEVNLLRSDGKVEQRLR